MKTRLPIVTLLSLLLVSGIVVLGGCSKDKGTGPTTTTTIPERFDSGDLVMGVPFTHTFGTAGTYAYRCIHHSSNLTTGMVGTVIVDDLSANMGAAVTVGTPTNSFNPSSVTIKTGTIVTWNLGSGTHTVTRP